MTSEEKDNLSDLVEQFMDSCVKNLKSKKLTSDHNIDFYIKKSVCLSSFKDLYLKINKRIKKSDLRNYLLKISTIFNEWIDIMDNHSIIKGLQKKCIPGSSSTLADVMNMEIYNGREWIKLGEKELEITYDNGDIANSLPVILFDTGGFSGSLLTFNLLNELGIDLNIMSKIQKSSINLCIGGGNLKPLGSISILWRFDFSKDKTYETEMYVVPEISREFRYGILFGDTFFQKYKTFSVRHDLEPYNPKSVNQAKFSENEDAGVGI